MTIGLPETEEPLSSSSSSLRNAGVLVVDEDAAFQLGLKTFLSEYVGFEKVFTASSGDEALDLIHSEESINVITLDYRMPGMTGIDVLEKLSQDTPRALTVLMLTGYPSDELESQFRSYNSSKLITSQFLSKPVEFEKLEPIILKSYEDLKASQRLTQTLTGESQDETAPISPEEEPHEAINPEIQEQLESLDAKLTLATTKIEELQSSMPNIQGQFWLGVLKLIAAIALIWMIIPMNWALKMKEYLPTTSDPVPAVSPSDPEPAPDQPAPPVSPAATDDEPAPEIPASLEPDPPVAPPADETPPADPAPPAPEPQDPANANEPLLTPADPASSPVEGQGRPL